MPKSISPTGAMQGDSDTRPPGTTTRDGSLIEPHVAAEPEWDLTGLFSDRAELDQELEALVRDAAILHEEHRERTRNPQKDLAETLDRIARLRGRVKRAEVYARLWRATRLLDSSSRALANRVQEVAARVRDLTAFVERELDHLSEDEERGLVNEPRLARWRGYLRRHLEMRPHTLSEREERVLSKKRPSSFVAWARLHSELVGRLDVRINGETTDLETVMAALRSRDDVLRRQSAAAMALSLAGSAHWFASALNAVLLDKRVDDELRRFRAWDSAFCLANQIPPSVVRSLVSAVARRYDIPQRYYAMKRKLLGVPRLTDHDRVAPLSGSGEYPWADALEIITVAYGRMSPVGRHFAKELVAARCIDARPRTGKMSNSFCSEPLPGLHPYILVNFTRDITSLSSLSHEFGHGVHALLAQDRGPLDCEPSPVMAEVAAAVSQIAVSLELASCVRGRSEVALRAALFEDAISSVFRTVAIYQFESQLHTAFRAEGDLSPQRVSEMWISTQREIGGTEVELTADYANWWCLIPHVLISPSYTIAYAFGYLVALLLCGKTGLADGRADAYFEALRQGGSQPTISLLSSLGVDPASAATWDQALDELEVRGADLEVRSLGHAS